MFHRTPDAAADPPTLDLSGNQEKVTTTEQLVSLVELELSLEAPGRLGGWDVYLAGHGVAVMADDIGRPAITRAAARMLIAEQAELEARKAELRAAAEKRAVEADQQWRASLGRGVPASAFAGHQTYGHAVAALELDSQQYRPRSSVIEDALDGGGLTFHSLATPAEE